MDTRRVQPDFTLPYDPSESAQNPYSDPIAPLYTDDPMQDQSFAPASNQQTFAFGMAPSFGSAQSEPAYGYYRDATPSFAPPQFSQDLPPAPSYAPQPEAESMPQYEPDTLLNYQPDAMPEDDREPNPYFRPFSDRGEDTFAPPRSHRFGSVARKARSFLNADEESQAVSYQDLQQTVDVSKAFHSPVYPKKKPEGD